MATAEKQARTLFDIGDDLEALEALLTDIGGDITDEDAEAAIDAWLSESADAEREKLDRYGWLRAEFLGRAERRREHAERLKALAEQDERNAARLEGRLLAYMVRRGAKKLEGDHFRYTAAGLGGKAPLVMGDIEPDLLAPRFRRMRIAETVQAPTDEQVESARANYSRVDVEPDREAIRAALEAGEELSFARIGERGKRLIVK